MRIDYITLHLETMKFERINPRNKLLESVRSHDNFNIEILLFYVQHTHRYERNTKNVH